MPIRRCLLVLSVVLFALPANAAKVKVWHQHTQSHYDKAKFKDAVVTSEGALRLSRQVKPLAGLEAANVWDLVEDTSRGGQVRCSVRARSLRTGTHEGDA